jgi:hypothetical protein
MAAGPHPGSGAVPQFSGGVPHISVTPAMAKLRARDRAQLVVIAYESGLVRPGWRA